MCWLLPCLLALLGGCHLLIAHEPTAQSSDRASALDSRPALDLPARRDRELPDLASADAECPPGQARCQGLCVDTQVDLANCGKCDAPCVPPDSCSVAICQLGSCTVAGKTCPPGQACSAKHKGQCCACIGFFNQCVEQPDAAACGINGAGCEPCPAEVCRTAACDAATGKCVPGPNLPDGTPCPGGTCVGGSCCKGCAKTAGVCLNDSDKACGPTCDDCTVTATSIPCRRYACVASSCQLADESDGMQCSTGPTAGICHVPTGQATSVCCTGCWDQQKGLCATTITNTQCGTAGNVCADCTANGTSCVSGACKP